MMSRLLLAALCAPLVISSLLAQTSLPDITVRSVRVLGAKDAVEIEVEASDRIVPQTKVLTGPDRLVVDFPNAVPGNQLRSQSVDRGEVKDLRIGLFQAKPPVTRMVLDLKAAQSYQIFPYGRTVMIKIMGGTSEVAASEVRAPSEPPARPGLVVANYTARAEPVRLVNSDQPTLDVTYRNGLLGIRANKATLSEVLFAVQQRTGAEVAMAAGAEQEKVVADIEPAPAPEVLARLLNGSKFNFLILSAPNDPQHLDRVILSPRPEVGYVVPLSPVQTDDPEEAASPASSVQPAIRAAAPQQAPPQPEVKTPPDQNTPDQ